MLSREEAGAEQIFRNDGVKLIQRLLVSKQEDVVLSALRTLVGLCTGHQSRVSVIVSSEVIQYIMYEVIIIDVAIVIPLLFLSLFLLIVVGVYLHPSGSV